MRCPALVRAAQPQPSWPLSAEPHVHPLLPFCRRGAQNGPSLPGWSSHCLSAGKAPSPHPTDCPLASTVQHRLLVLGEAGKILTPPWCEALQTAKQFLSFLPALCSCVVSQSRPARSEDRDRATGTVPAAVANFVAVGTSLLKRLQDNEVRQGGLRAPLHAPAFPGCRSVPKRQSCRSSWATATAPCCFPQELTALSWARQSLWHKSQHLSSSAFAQVTKAPPWLWFGNCPSAGAPAGARSNAVPQGAGCLWLPLPEAWPCSHAFPFVTVHLDLSYLQDSILCDLNFIS